MESINQSINQERERIFAKRMLPRRPLSSRRYIFLLRERERERKKRERKRERESASVVCVKGVEKMAPFFPMEKNVEGKITFFISFRTRTHTQKQHSLCRKNIHPSERQTDRRRRRRRGRRRFFLCRVLRRVKIPFYHYTHTHHHGEENEEDVSSRVLLRHAHAATKLGHSLSFCRIIIA